MCDIELRTRKLLRLERDKHGRGFWKELERYSDIPADRWRAAFHDRQGVTFEMLSIVCLRYPSYGLWLATGRSQPDYGHYSPEGLRTYPFRFVPEHQLR